MKNFSHVIRALEQFDVPKKRLQALEAMASGLNKLKRHYAKAGLSEVSATRLRKILVASVISSTAIMLFKKYTGKKILVVWGSARDKVIYPGTAPYDRMEALCAQFGPGWIIVHGGGGAIMDAARQGGKRGGSPTVALHFDGEYAAGEDQGLTDTINLYHGEFYSRLFAFLEYADAVIIGEGGLGTLQEKSWVEGCLQCGFHLQLPVFVLAKEFFVHIKSHFKQMLTAKLCSEKDKELIRSIEIGEEHKVPERIALYYARRPELVEKRRLALVSQDEKQRPHRRAASKTTETK